jgi:hypothetical protein
MAESLKEQHPDVTEVVWKFGRYQHSVDYSKFYENRLVLKDDVKYSSGVDNYGMVLKRIKQ